MLFPEINLEKQTKRIEFNERLFEFCNEAQGIAAQVIAQTKNVCRVNFDLGDYDTEHSIKLLEQSIDWVSRSRKNWKLLASIVNDVDFSHGHYLSILNSDLKRYRRRLDEERFAKLSNNN